VFVVDRKGRWYKVVFLDDRFKRKEILRRYGYLFPAFRNVFENKYMLLFQADIGYIRFIGFAIVKVACCSMQEFFLK
jgi:hypothetical protein